jgi:hypothetical protein
MIGIGVRLGRHAYLPAAVRLAAAERAAVGPSAESKGPADLSEGSFPRWPRYVPAQRWRHENLSGANSVRG